MNYCTYARYILPIFHLHSRHVNYRAPLQLHIIFGRKKDRKTSPSARGKICIWDSRPIRIVSVEKHLARGSDWERL
jgi:hypothetical protein